VKPSGFYRSSFGNVRIWCSKISTPMGRNLVIHEMSGGNSHVVQDMGPVIQTVSASLLFDYMNGDDDISPKERLEQFRALVGTEQVLTHPLTGSQKARVGPFTETVDDSGVISADVEFTPTQDTLDVIPAGASSIPASGEGAVDSAAQALQDEIAALGLVDDGIAAACVAAVSTWGGAQDLDPRDVSTDVGSMTQRISDKLSTYDKSLDYFELFKRYALLADKLYIAGKAATQQGATYAFRVGVATTLRSLVAAEYGAENADYYADQVMKLNDIVYPGLLVEGDTYTFPQKTSAVRNG
jgi:hypothetical protein